MPFIWDLFLAGVYEIQDAFSDRTEKKLLKDNARILLDRVRNPSPPKPIDSIPDPKAKKLPYEDRELLKGTKFYEHCAKCGLYYSLAPGMLFCSEECREKAAKPYLPTHLEDTFEETSAYQHHIDVESDIRFESDRAFYKEAKAAGFYGTRAEFETALAQAREREERDYKQRRVNYENQALVQFLENWERQRETLLVSLRAKHKIEVEKREKKEAEDWEKIKAKGAADRAKAAEQLRKEQEKVDAELQKQKDYEDSIAPRPVPEKARLESTLIVAGAGWGKTQLLQSIIAQDLQKPDPPSYIVLDSTGALIEAIQRLAIFDGHLRDRILIIDPAYSPSLNMLDFSASRYASYTTEQREDLETDITGLFNYIFASTDYDLSGQMGTAFAYAIKLMMSRKASTLEDLTRLLEEQPKTYRDSYYIHDIERLPYGKDFFEHQFYSKSLVGTRAAIARRIHSLLRTPAFRRMFNVPINKLDLFDEMNRGTIILVNTNVNLLKEDGMALFGRYIIGRTIAAAFERSTIPFNQRRPTFLMIDEAEPYFDETFERLFTRARQFRLANIVVFQHLMQASDRLIGALTSSTRVKYAAALGAPDRRRMSQDMETTPEFIASMKCDLRDDPQWSEFACYVRPDFPTAVKQTIQFHQIDNMPKMSDVAHQRLLERNKLRLQTHKPSPEDDGLRAVAPIPAEADPPSIPQKNNNDSDDAAEWTP